MARLSSHVATRRPDLEHLFMADLHGAGFRAPGLADVPDAGAGDRHHPCLARFAGYAAIAAARWRVSRSGSAPGGPWRITWLPGIPRTWNHPSSGLATWKLRTSLFASVRPTRICHTPGTVEVRRRTFWCCGGPHTSLCRRAARQTRRMPSPRVCCPCCGAQPFAWRTPFVYNGYERQSRTV
jgi:hypothetical protein